MGIRQAEFFELRKTSVDQKPKAKQIRDIHAKIDRRNAAHRKLYEEAADIKEENNGKHARLKEIEEAQAGVQKNIDTAKEKLKEVLTAVRKELGESQTRYGDDRVGENGTRFEKILVAGEYRDSVSPLELLDEAVSRCSQTRHESEEM